MQLFFKRILGKFYLAIIFFSRVIKGSNKNFKNNNILDLFDKYSNKKKIVVLCSGPSANKVKLSKDNVYFVTNSANSIVKKYDFLFYINDGFYIKKILAFGRFFLKKKQDILFYFENSKNHKIGLNYLVNNMKSINDKNIYLLSNVSNSKYSNENINLFHKFYAERQLQVKIQNSGVFLLLIGYLMSIKTGLPLEIYGLDLGEGGNKHFDNKGVVGKSVTADRVKKNVKIYLDLMYKEHSNISNFSNFNGNMN